MGAFVDTQQEMLEIMSRMMAGFVNIKDELREMNRNGQQNLEKIESAITKSGGEIVKKISKLTNAQNRDVNNFEIAAIADLAHKDVPNWQNLLNERKMDYFRNEKIATKNNSRWREMDPLVISKKYQRKIVPAENEQFK